jgi:hypothetical protein
MKINTNKQKYNKLLILKLIKKNNETWAECLCDCGQKCIKKLSMIKINHTKSCGCMALSTRFQKNSKISLKNDFSKFTPEGAYWLGFLFGDGNIDDHGKLQICLSIKSHRHLQKLSKFLVGKDITKTYYNKRCTLQITNEVLSEKLKKYGIIPRKTKISTIILPKQKKLIPHYIRGYIDADGWISSAKSYNKKYNKYYQKTTIGLCSYLIKNIEIVLNNLPVKAKIFKSKNRELYNLQYSKKTAIKKIYNYLYNKKLNLEYKWNKIKQLLK